MWLHERFAKQKPEGAISMYFAPLCRAMPNWFKHSSIVNAHGTTNKLRHQISVNQIVSSAQLFWTPLSPIYCEFSYPQSHNSAHRATGEIIFEKFLHLAARIRDFRENIRGDGVSAWAPQNYSAGALTTTVSPSGRESIFNQLMAISVTCAGLIDSADTQRRSRVVPLIFLFAP